MRRARAAWAVLHVPRARLRLFRMVLPLLSLLCGVAAAQTQADPALLGRLFSTPQERAALDARRAGGVDQPGAAPDAGGMPYQPPSGLAGVAPAATAPVKPPAVTLDGIVRRSDGSATVWLNQQPQPVAIDPQRKNKAAAGAVVRSDHGVLTLKLASGKRVPLKPGQRYGLDDGSIKEDREERK